jgi:hypothetical protein
MRDEGRSGDGVEVRRAPRPACRAAVIASHHSRRWRHRRPERDKLVPRRRTDGSYGARFGEGCSREGDSEGQSEGRFVDSEGEDEAQVARGLGRV